MKKSLYELLRRCDADLVCGDPHIEVQNLQFDSRHVEAGSAFFAIPGTQVDGHDFILEAIDLGAVAVVCEKVPFPVPKALTVFRVESASDAFGWAANAFYDFPSNKIKLVGVTGTNGKTTTVSLLYQLFRSAGYSCGLLSTVQNLIKDRVVPSTHTTGDALQITRLMAEMVEAGCSHCFMEVTSHAIDQNRISGLNFDVALFTNISHEHLDYHGTFKSYRDVKKKYFDNLLPNTTAVFNADDVHWEYLAQGCDGQKISYGRHHGADYTFYVKRNDLSGMQIEICGRTFKMQLFGDFNAYNMIACLVAAEQLGLSVAQSLQHVKNLESAPGRMEKVDCDQNLLGIVDYAHTPDAIQQVISAVREIAQPTSKIVAVIGCAGNRDREKRPKMAKIAYDLSDYLVITSVDSRSEEPMAIIDEMASGLPDNLDDNRVFVVEDRAAAITKACSVAPDGAIILILGKGHEKFQIVGSVKRPFDDVKVFRNACQQRHLALRDLE